MCRVGLSNLQLTQQLANFQKFFQTNLNLGLYVHNDIELWHLVTSMLATCENLAGYFAFYPYPESNNAKVSLYTSFHS